MQLKTKEKSELGRRLQILRGDESRSMFCARTGLVERSLGNWERGNRIPDATVLAGLRDTTSVNLNWLLTGEGAMFDDVEKRGDSRGDISMAEKSEPGPREAWDHEAFQEALKQANAYEETLVDGYLLPEDKFNLVSSLYRDIIVKKE